MTSVQELEGKEVVPGTSPTPSSGSNVQLIPPEPAPVPGQLCGYLMKASKGPLKTWKSRWFVFEDHQCCLFYYTSQVDLAPLGYINISNAMFSYSVEDSTSFQFDIRAEGRIHSLQARSREVMFYWMNQLQSRRRKFSEKRRMDTFMEHSREDTKRREEPVELGLSKDDSKPDGNHAVDNESPELQRSQIPQQQMSGSPAQPKFSLREHLTGLFRPPKSGTVPQEQQQSGSDGNEPRTGDADRECVEPATATSASSSTANDVQRMSFSRKFLSKIARHSQVLPGAYPNICEECHMARLKVAELEHEIQCKEQEVKDRDAINEFLRNEIKEMEMKKKVMKELMAPSDMNMEDDKKLDVILQRDQVIAKYEALLEEATIERERLSKELEMKQFEVEEKGEQIDLLTETVAAKDHVVVQLTNKLFEIENKGQVPMTPSDAMKPTTVASLQLELRKLKEAVEAYKNQNQFLSIELLEMNQLRSDELAVNKLLVQEYHELEAKFIQLESKHLVLLREAQEPEQGVSTGLSGDLVSQMMEEVLGQRDQAVAEKESSGAYDKYGFCHSQHDSLEGDDDLLRVKVRRNELQAARVQDEMDLQHKLQWDLLWSQHVGTKHLQRSAHLKQLIRKGVPQGYRTEVWKWIIKTSLKDAYQPGLYAELMKKHADYTSVAMNQIELDLYRTLPTHKHYKTDGEWIHKLRRVLVAFSWYNTSIGYCQGLNRLAAIALLFLDEEHAFWCLVTIIHHHLPPDYYDQSLLGSQADQRVLKDILAERAPALTLHLAKCDIDFSLITFNWFHTIFVDTMPSNTMIRIWDTFLYEGSKVLFRYAVAIFLYNQGDLLAEKNSIDIFNRLRSMCKEATDVKRLTEIAFNELTRFSMDMIRRKREYYRKQIKGEMEALDKQRMRLFPTQTKEDHAESDEDPCEEERTLPQC